MDEQFVTELIEDLEHMRQLLDRCVRRLRSQVPSVVSTASAPVRITEPQNDIRAEIERQRREIMSQVEQVKTQALQTAAAARTRSSMPAAGASGMGMGLAGIANLGSPTPEVLEKLRRQITEKIQAGDKPEKSNEG